MPNDQWSEWQRFVLAELKALRVDQKETIKVVTQLRIDNALIKMRVGFLASAFGAAAGAIAPLLPAVIQKVLTSGAHG